jgi:hypothetical protein
VTAALAIPMHHATSTTTATRPPRALGRFWPLARPAAFAPIEGWRETLGRFWPRSCISPHPTAQKPARRTAGAAVPRRDRASAPRKLRPGARPKSLGLQPLTDKERKQLARDERDLRRAGAYRNRPRVYGDCEDTAGPCPWVRCRFNLFLEVDELTGAIKLNFPDKEIDQLAETCALRVVDQRGALSLEEVGKLVNLTQERVSQIEESGLAKQKRGLGDRRRLLQAVQPEVGDAERLAASSDP